MELSYDWKSFQTVFMMRRRHPLPEGQRPIYLVTDKRLVVSALSENEDLSEWVGNTYDEMRARFTQREFIVFERSKVDHWMGNGGIQPHYYEQARYLGDNGHLQQLLSVSSVGKCEPHLPKHFLLSAIQSWWNKVLPSSYGIYIRLEGGVPGGGIETASLLMIVQRGKLSSFHVPDLSSMVLGRSHNSKEVVKFLSERHLVPVQGLFLSASEWEEWSIHPNPWRKIATALKANRNKLMPSKWGLLILIALRAYFHF